MVANLPRILYRFSYRLLYDINNQIERHRVGSIFILYDIRLCVTVVHDSRRILATTAVRIQNNLHDRWLTVLVMQTILLEIFIAAPNFLLAGRPRINGDGMFFLYSGWSWVTEGVVPYHNLVDIKPPLAHEYGALLAILAGGDPYLQSLLGAATTTGAVVVTVALVGSFAYRWVDDARAAYAAGTAVLAYPLYYGFPGFRPKYFTIAFGLLAVWLSLRERHVFSGASAATAAGFWQFGAVFPALVVGRMAIRRDWPAAGRTVGGAVVVTALVIVPIAFAGLTAVADMIEQVVFLPMIAAEHTPLSDRVSLIFNTLGPAMPAVVLGGIGALLPAVIAAKRVALEHPRNWDVPTLWLSVVTAWFLLQVFVFDLDGGMDLLPLLTCCALGYGSLARFVGERTTLLLLAVVTVVIGLYTAGAINVYIQPAPWNYESGSLAWRYWERVPPASSCYIKKGTEWYLTHPAKELGLPPGPTCGYNFETVVRIVLGLSDTQH